MSSMGLKDIAFCNLKRRKVKNIFLTFGLLVGVSVVVALFATVATMQADINRKMDEYGANMVIVPDAVDLFLSYGGMAISSVSSPVNELTEEDAAKIWTIRNKENINIVAPKLLGLTEVEGKRGILLGVNFQDELRIRPWWLWRGKAPVASNEVMLGNEAARKLDKDVGDKVNVNGRPLLVTTVLESTGTQEDDYVYTDLHEAQLILGKPGKVSIIEVSAWCASCPIANIVLQTSLKLPHARVTAVKQAIATKADVLQVLERFALAMSLVVLLVGSLIVLNTMMAAVHERTGEIGILRAVGFRRSHVMLIILQEVAVLSLISGLLGFALGTFLAKVMAEVVAHTVVQVQWDPVLGLAALGLALAVGGLGGLYPAWQASRLDPVTALRSL